MIAFERIQAGVGSVWVMNANGSGQRRLTPSAEDDDYLAAWSPDGKKLAFDRTAGNAFGDIYVNPMQHGSEVDLVIHVQERPRIGKIEFSGNADTTACGKAVAEMVE